MLKKGDGLQMQVAEKKEVSNVESLHPARNYPMISPTWMYDWMDDLKDFDIWKKSVDSEEDLSNVFAFRESKIYTLKRVREKLHRLQATMVRIILVHLIFFLFALLNSGFTACLANARQYTGLSFSCGLFHSPMRM